MLSQEQELISIAQDLRRRIHIADRRFRLKLFKACFVGSEAVSYLVHNKYVATREDAVQLCREMSALGFIEHVSNQYIFKDAYLFYRFSDIVSSPELTSGKVSPSPSFHGLNLGSSMRSPSPPPEANSPQRQSLGSMLPAQQGSLSSPNTSRKPREMSSFYNLPRSKSARLVELHQVALSMQRSLITKDRKWRQNVYVDCFTGSEAVDWLIDNDYANSRESAILIGRQIQELGWFSHIVHRYPFRDAQLFYRWEASATSAYKAQPSASTTLPNVQMIDYTHVSSVDSATAAAAAAATVATAVVEGGSFGIIATDGDGNEIPVVASHEHRESVLSVGSEGSRFKPVTRMHRHSCCSVTEEDMPSPQLSEILQPPIPGEDYLPPFCGDTLLPNYVPAADSGNSAEGPTPGEEVDYEDAPSATANSVSSRLCSCDNGSVATEFSRPTSEVTFNEMYFKCAVCARRPADWLCMGCWQGLCSRHCGCHYRDNPTHRVVINNDLSMYEHIYWCLHCSGFMQSESFDDILQRLVETRTDFLDIPIDMPVSFVKSLVLDPISSIWMPSTTSDSVSTAADYGLRHATVVSCSMQGWRSSNEDQVTIIPSLPQHPHLSFFGVYDGHCGPYVAKYIGSCLPPLLDMVALPKPASEDEHHTDQDDNDENGNPDHQVRHRVQFQEEAETATATATATATTTGNTAAAHANKDPTEAETYRVAVQDAFVLADEQLKKATAASSSVVDWGSCGCTGLVVMLTPDYFVCANAGDCRAVLARAPQGSKLRPTSPLSPASSSSSATSFSSSSLMNSNSATTLVMDYVAVALSKDHKPELPEESSRILSAGYRVRDGRVEGLLSVCRGFGDFDFKQCGGRPPSEQAVTCWPDVTVTPRQPKPSSTLPSPDSPPSAPSLSSSSASSHFDHFLVLACDGLWDVYSSEQVVQFIATELYRHGNPKRAAESLLRSAVAPARTHPDGAPMEGTDNISLILLVFD